MEKTTGRVKWFDDAKGFGFIERDDKKGDVFVHYSKIKSGPGGKHKTLAEGSPVEFGIEETQRGPQALDVTVVG